MMRLPAPALVFGLILAGCSPGSNEPISAEPEFSRTAYPPQPRSTGLAAMRPSIAARPDDGDLVRYDKVRRIERGGVYTSYPVSLSEAHAYRSLAGGELVVTAPDGRSTRLRVARHEEYPDGNWTLLARGDDGSDAILTFGQDAVFGAINREDGTVLRFLTQGRQVYLVSADRERLAGLENPGAGKRSDMLIPPARPPHAASAASAAGLATPEQPQSVINTAGANDIDVLMGYSNGLVSRIGSESGAVTRMQNLVAFANEAYANSGITMRLRLVRSMLVNYPDNTTNQDALQKMTGSTGTGSTPVDPAFNALRAAREETGADVVAFVRQFREPENDGCGIAWLLGGSQSAITQNDAAFAYSVSSDGSDLRESDGKTYFCRDETLAHEAGHNMGQAHNQEDSTSGGAHTYSYGYREPSAAGFYTVMAYRVTDSSQFPIRYFANPSIAYQGRATGVANQSDNARSMNLTMPIIANFRAAIVPSANRVTSDVDADRRSDFVWYNSTTRRIAYWVMNGNAIVRHGEQSTGGGYNVLTNGDFNGDGRVDLVWVGTAGDMQMWQGNGNTFDWRPFVQYPGGWTLIR